MDRRTPQHLPLTRHQRDEAGIFFDRAEALLDQALEAVGNSFSVDCARTFLSIGFYWANFHLRHFT